MLDIICYYMLYICFLSIPPMLLYQVSHEMASELAHAIVEEVSATFGAEASGLLASGKLLRSMSQAFATGHAASMTRAALEAEPEIHASIPVSNVDVGLLDLHPVLYCSNYVKTLANVGKLKNLTGGCESLLELWETWQPLRPHHPCYALSQQELLQTIPIYIIADEGRSFKKSTVMVLGWEPVLGNGCDVEDEITALHSMKLNFRGNTIKTRALFAVMGKNMYAKDASPLHKLVEFFAEDLRTCFLQGLQLRHRDGEQTWRIAAIGLKGDWPALDKLGRLFRHFRREAYPHGQGICHLCLANTAACPTWHECDFRAAPWIRTIPLNNAAWRPGQDALPFTLNFFMRLYASLLEASLKHFHLICHFSAQAMV